MAPRTKRRKFDPDTVQKALVKKLIIDELPFSVVEQHEFKETMESAFPGFQIPSPETISRVCDQIFMDEKLKLKSFMKITKQKVCLSLDTWRSNESVNYLCVTAHFIDDNWYLHKKIIGFSPICNDDGDEIGKVVEKCLHDWEIDNVLTISACNASSYDAAVSYLGTRLVNNVSDGRFLRVKCFGEIINTLVKQVLKDFEKWITRVREAVRLMLQTPDRIEKFKKVARKYRMLFECPLILDCPARWTSTFEMLQMAEKFEDVFNWFEKNDLMYKHEMYNACGIPFCIKWEKVRKALVTLERFSRVTKERLKSHVTSDLFLAVIVGVDFELDDWGISCLRSEKLFSRALEMKWKYNEYWGDVEDANMLIYMANILTPFYKMDYIETYLASKIAYRHEYTHDGEPLWKKKMEWVVAGAYDLFNEYARMLGAPHQNANFQTSGYMDYLRHARRSVELGCQRNVGFGGNVGCKTEIDIYLTEGINEYIDGFDILVWWKVNSKRFPVLSKIAKDIFAIPMSAIALDSDINIDGNLLDDFRSSLSPLMVESLVCTQDWINKSKKQIKVHEGPTKLDKFVKGIYEQLEDTTSECESNS